MVRIPTFAPAPSGDVRLEGITVRVSGVGWGLADARLSMSDADRLLLADRVRKLGEPAVLLRHDERLAHHSSSSWVRSRLRRGGGGSGRISVRTAAVGMRSLMALRSSRRRARLADSMSRRLSRTFGWSSSTATQMNV